MMSVRFLYDLSLPLEEKMRTIAREIYGADDISLSDEAKEELDRFTKQVRQLWLLCDVSFCVIM